MRGPRIAQNCARAPAAIASYTLRLDGVSPRGAKQKVDRSIRARYESCGWYVALGSEVAASMTTPGWPASLVRRTRRTLRVSMVGRGRCPRKKSSVERAAAWPSGSSAATSQLGCEITYGTAMLGDGWRVRELRNNCAIIAQNCAELRAVHLCFESRHERSASTSSRYTCEVPPMHAPGWPKAVA